MASIFSQALGRKKKPQYVALGARPQADPHEADRVQIDPSFADGVQQATSADLDKGDGKLDIGGALKVLATALTNASAGQSQTEDSMPQVNNATDTDVYAQQTENPVQIPSRPQTGQEQVDQRPQIDPKRPWQAIDTSTDGRPRIVPEKRQIPAYDTSRDTNEGIQVQPYMPPRKNEVDEWGDPIDPYNQTSGAPSTLRGTDSRRGAPPTRQEARAQIQPPPQPVYTPYGREVRGNPPTRENVPQNEQYGILPQQVSNTQEGSGEEPPRFLNQKEMLQRNIDKIQGEKVVSKDPLWKDVLLGAVVNAGNAFNKNPNMSTEELLGRIGGSATGGGLNRTWNEQMSKDTRLAKARSELAQTLELEGKQINNDYYKNRTIDAQNRTVLGRDKFLLDKQKFDLLRNQTADRATDDQGRITIRTKEGKPTFLRDENGDIVIDPRFRTYEVTNKETGEIMKISGAAIAQSQAIAEDRANQLRWQAQRANADWEFEAEKENAKREETYQKGVREMLTEITKTRADLQGVVSTFNGLSRDLQELYATQSKVDANRDPDRYNELTDAILAKQGEITKAVQSSTKLSGLLNELNLNLTTFSPPRRVKAPQIVIPEKKGAPAKDSEKKGAPAKETITRGKLKELLENAKKPR